MPGVDYVSPKEEIVGLWGPLEPTEGDVCSYHRTMHGGVKVPRFWSIAIGPRGHMANLKHPGRVRTIMQRCIKVRVFYIAAEVDALIVSPPKIM
jgi:hypothetical protein